MKKKFSLLAQNYQNTAIDLLSKWIQIDSVYDETTIEVGAPFGRGVMQALRYIGAIAEKDGFEVSYNDGYATEISFGTGPIIGVYAHADVVPVSGTWTNHPFSGAVVDNRVYGRGASDDKGPAIAAYMAMRLLKDHHLTAGYRMRLVIGGNEERGSGCLHYYFHELKKPHCVAGFTPDGEFPLIYGEKGISNYKLEGKLNLGPIISVNAGVVSNSVIDRAEAIVKKDLSIESYLATTIFRYQVNHEGDTTRIVILGKAAHGSLPELGVNAGIQMLDALGHHYGIESLQTIANQYREPFGRSLGHYYESPLLHHTTYNVGLISYKDGVFSMVVNFRFPETVIFEETIKQIGQKSILPVTVLMYSRPLLFDPDSPMVQTMLKAYREESGDTDSQMMTIGGGTYAKEALNTVAFGSHFPGKEDNIHDINEKIDLEDLQASIGIYARAIYDLGQLYAAKK
jgi:succinyl-diaminopimelate desuccinylase